ncbi:MAG: hypothetical protein GIW99_01895 [Candidatus Eremiobacteraeota bacterium]|nr:hypothetical protein [Candidatus Eremiobacteraeota bacterium]MBC5826428.1 hypothetical protein [Candidatus Eremiobacteraeota bacterium]
MQTVSQAKVDGWQPLLPIQRCSHDHSVILVARNHPDAGNEIGFARVDGSMAGG